MNKLVIMLCAAALFLGGCGVTVVPMATATASVNLADNSVTEAKDGVTVTARMQDLEVAPYRMVDNITSFHLAIENGTAGEVTFPLASFYLVDGEGNQYRPIQPSEIEGIVSRDSSYLIPYPYVGYYYLEDAEKASFYNTFDSALPYFAESYPQDIYTQALPVDAILPGGRISGLLYFVVDLALKNSVELRIYRPGTPVTGPPDYTLPFNVEK